MTQKQGQKVVAGWKAQPRDGRPKRTAKPPERLFDTKQNDLSPEAGRWRLPFTLY
jgi:hypothetical protein